VTFSIGAVVFPQPGHPAVMLDLADSEMYSVKQAGKDHYRILVLADGKIPTIDRNADGKVIKPEADPKPAAEAPTAEAPR
jgi:hypothetical protein